MSTLVFTSGTKDGKPKDFIYTNEDIANMKKAVSHVVELTGLSGILINTIPAFPHMGYSFCKMCEECYKDPILSTGGYKMLDIDKHLGFIKKLKPAGIIGIEGVVKELILLSDSESLENLKSVIIINGLSEEVLAWFKEHNIEVKATYGLTEAKMAWATGDNLEEGYHVFKDSGVRFESINGELILFSKDYPDGLYTGDMGTVIDEEDRQRISFVITRKDGKSKNLIGCSTI